jgi:hypothetical protein
MSLDIQKTNTICKVIDHYYEVKSQGYKILLVLDIDGVVLSNSFYKTFEEPEICELVKDAYETDSENIMFLTNRNKSV